MEEIKTLHIDRCTIKPDMSLRAFFTVDHIHFYLRSNSPTNPHSGYIWGLHYVAKAK